MMLYSAKATLVQGVRISGTQVMRITKGSVAVTRKVDVRRGTEATSKGVLLKQCRRVSGVH
jgi:hypothetical protein